MDTHTNNDNLEKDLKNIEQFREDVLQNRQELKHHDEESFVEVENDAEYQLLLQNSDLTLGDKELEEATYVKKFARKNTNTTQDPTEQDHEDLIEENQDSHQDTQDLKGETSDYNKYLLKTRQVFKENTDKAADMIAKQRHDIELLIGEKGTIVAGSAILMVTTLILIRYGINEGFISEGMRLFIGVFVASSFIGLAYRSNENEALSTVFLLGGACILYYDSYLSYYDYGVVEKLASFFFNVVITALVFGFAIYYRRTVLIVAALFGAYLTPILAGLGHENYFALYSYLIAINLIVLYIAYRMDWFFLNPIVFICTLLPFSVWVFGTNMASQDTAMEGFIFASLIYLTFFMRTAVYGLHSSYEFRLYDIPIFFVNLFIYYIFSYKIFNDIAQTEAYLGFFTFGIGLFHGLYLALYYRFDYKQEQLFGYFQFIFLALITFSPTMMLTVDQMNEYWAIESVVLLLLARYTGLVNFRHTSAVSILFIILLLAYDWIKIYSGIDYQAFFFNGAVFTAAITLLALAANLYIILYKEKAEYNILFLPADVYAGILSGLMLVIFWLIGNIEISYHNFGSLPFTRLLIGNFNSYFVIAVWLFAVRTQAEAIRQVSSYFMGFVVIFYIIYGLGSAIDLRDSYLLQSGSFLPFALHYLNIFASLLAAYLLVKDAYLRFGEQSRIFTFLVRYASLIFMFHASTELTHFMVISAYDHGDDINEILSLTYKVGFSILWAVCAFLFMTIGMKYKLRDFRVVSLVLFGMILLKYFVIDFWTLEFLGKIISSMFLGVLLLLVGKLYRQLLAMVEEGVLTNTSTKNETEHQA